jgi:uncharacterized protein YhfF
MRAYAAIGRLRGDEGARVEHALSVVQMWAAFREARPDIAGAGEEFSAWHFCDNQRDADELAQLVLAGAKRATAGALWAYELEGEPVPTVGDFSVITYWDGRACCVIRTTAVEVVAFESVSEEFATAEGEGDGSLAYWRDAHLAAFGREFAGTERSVTPDMPVVCERFEVVFGVGRGVVG